MGFPPILKPGLALSALLVVLSNQVRGDKNWCYLKDDCSQDSPSSDWKKGVCGAGKAQSPIDIDTDYVKMKGATSIDWGKSRKNYEFTQFKMKNTGASVQLDEFETSTGKEAGFEWPERDDAFYTLQQIHLHWGPTDDVGSEHSIDGETHSVEMHLVHYKSGGDDHFDDFDSAVASGQPDALAVIAIFLQAAEVEYDYPSPLGAILDYVVDIADTGEKASVSGVKFQVSDLLLVQNRAVTYMGSLTTPQCNEVVAWMVTPHPIKMSMKDMGILRNAISEVDGNPLTMNYRRVKELNKRELRIVEFVHDY